MTSIPLLHILMVEDNDSLREATVAFLQTQGHQVTGLVCAEEVDETPTRGIPDLYLLDVNLPDENGFRLAERIRQSQPLAGIILMTARGQLTDRLEGYTSGADTYLVKPVEPSELLACINNLARRLKANKALPEADLLFNSQTLCLSGPKAKTSLTYGEGQLLVAMCRSAGQKIERWQAMQLIDTKDKGLLPANLEMRISTLRKKLSLCGAQEDAIKTLRGFGYGLSCQIELR